MKTRPISASVTVAVILAWLGCSGMALGAGTTPPPCDFSAALTEAKADLQDSQVAAARQMLKITHELGNIVAEAGDPAKEEATLAELLTPEQSARLSALTQRLQTIQLWQLIDSKRERDLNIISQMTMLADQMSKFEIEIAESDPRHVAWGLLGMMQVTLQEADQPTEPEVACSVDRALWQMSMDTVMTIAGLDIDDEYQWLQDLRQRYGFTGGIEQDKLSKADKEKLDSVREVLIPSLRQRALFLDIENIRKANRVSELLHRYDSSDIGRSGGDVEAIGASVSRLVKENQLSQDDATLVGLWRLVNEKVPAPVIQNMEAIANPNVGGEPGG